jgi:ribosomal subunit interface protein
VDIVITGRRMDVPDRFKRFAEEKLSKVTQFAPRAYRIDVELSHERNPRQSATCEKVEITVRDKGPVIRAEACAEDVMAAMDLASGKLVERLRRMGDRKKVHHGRHTPVSVRSAEPAMAPLGAAPSGSSDGDLAAAGPGLSVAQRSSDHEHGDGFTSDGDPAVDDLPEGVEELAGSPVVIRTKEHEAHPMTIDQALYEMELVGHDFYLFIDAACGKPSVVYRRRGWNYGVIRLGSGEAVTT